MIQDQLMHICVGMYDMIYSIYHILYNIYVYVLYILYAQTNT